MYCISNHLAAIAYSSNLTIKFRWKKKAVLASKCSMKQSALIREAQTAQVTHDLRWHVTTFLVANQQPDGICLWMPCLWIKDPSNPNPPSSRALIGINGKLNFKPSVNSSPKDPNLKKPFGRWLSCVLLFKKKVETSRTLKLEVVIFKCHISAKALSPEFRCQQCHEAVRGCTWWHHTFCNKNG